MTVTVRATVYGVPARLRIGAHLNVARVPVPAGQRLGDRPRKQSAQPPPSASWWNQILLSTVLVMASKVPALEVFSVATPQKYVKAVSEDCNPPVAWAASI